MRGNLSQARGSIGMPDQHDPKQAPRSPYGRPAERRAAPEEDPLVELARMVHGRPSHSATAVTRPARQAEPPAPADLESELLNDLQASFAAVREAAAQVAAPAPRPQTVAPPSAPPSEPPRPRPQAQTPEPTYAPSSFAPRPQPQPAPPPPRLEPRPDARSDVVRPEFRLEPFDESRLVPIPPPPVIQPSVPPGYAERIEQRAAAAAAEPFPRLFERAREASPSPSREDEEFAAFQLRPSTPATAAVQPAAPVTETPAAPPRAAPSRWEKPAAVEPPPVASRFAPPPASEPEQQLDFDDEDLDPFAEAGLFPPAHETNEDEFETGEAGLAPEYAEEDEDPFPPLDEAGAAGRSSRAGPPRGLMIVAAVVAVALVGGLAVTMFRSGQNSTGTPPTILADGAPTKITPDSTASPAASDADAQNKLIYDRVNSAEANNNTTLLTPDNGPIQQAPQSDAGNAISRVILPGGPGYDAPGAKPADGTQAAAPPEADDALGPRKVRTVVVKPDGTILSSSASDAGSTDGSTAPAAAPASAAPASAATAAPAAPATTAAAAPAPVTDDTAAIAGTGGDSLAITTNPDPASAPAIPAPSAAVPASAAPAPVTEAPAPTPVKKPVKVAAAPVTTADPNGPIDLTSGGNASAAQPAATADGVFVQVSSQRTEDAARATYKDLQTRYPSILGKYDVDLQQADVPSRGTFYRVRVGPFSSADAQRLCDDLRSAGGDCVLARR